MRRQKQQKVLAQAAVSILIATALFFTSQQVIDWYHDQQQPPQPSALVPFATPATTAFDDIFGDLINRGLKDPPAPPAPEPVVPQQAPAVPAAPTPPRPQPPQQPSPEFVLANLASCLADNKPRVALVDHLGVEKSPALISKDPITGSVKPFSCPGRYDLEINLSQVKRLELRNAAVTNDTLIKYEEALQSGFVNSVSVDLSGLNFSNATYTAVAQKYELFKCKNWSFATQACNGDWAKIQDIAPGMTYTVALGPDDPSLAESAGIFFDGFENGFGANNWTINGTGKVWTNTTTNPFNGTQHANAQQPSASTSMRVNVSTQNYTSIAVSYARRLVGLDGPDEFHVRWFNGTAWQILEETGAASANDAAYVVKNFTLDATANNNSNLVLEFMCLAGQAAEHCRVDDVRVNGTEFGALPGITSCPVTVSQSSQLANSVTSSGNCIAFGASNILLDCKGNTITYANTDAGVGITAGDKTNLTIKNCIIRAGQAANASTFGISFSNVNHSMITNNTILTNGTNSNHGILLQIGSNNNTVSNNTVRASGSANFNIGIFVTGSSMDNKVLDNTINTSGTVDNTGILLLTSADRGTVARNAVRTTGSGGSNEGILVDSSVQATVDNNTVITNGTGSNHGLLLQSSAHNNTAQGNTIIAGGSANFNIGAYFTAATDNTVAHNRINTTGTVDNTGVLLQSNKNILLNNTVSASGSGGSNEGILVDGTSQHNITQNTIVTNGTSSNHGVLLQSNAHNNTLNGNKVVASGSANSNVGIYLINSSGNNLTANSVNTSGTDDNSGIILQTDSSRNIVTENTVRSRGNATSNEGILLLELSSNNTLERNTIITNGTSTNHGIFLQNQTNNNTVMGNTVTASGSANFNVGMILLLSSQDNSLENNTVRTSGSDSDHGFFLASASDNNRIVSNNITTTSASGFSAGIGAENITSMTIASNTFSANLTELYLFNTTGDIVVNDSTLNNYNLTNVSLTVAKTGKGKLKFLKKITRNGKNLSADIRLGARSISVNSTATPEFNQSAEITFFDTNFTDVAIASDFEDDGTFIECPDDICVVLENNQTTQQVRFNVTRFANHTAEDAEVNVSPISPANGSSFLLNATIDKRVNATALSIRRIDTVRVSITFPNGTVVLRQLFNGTKDIFNLSFLDLVQRGRYNITFLANDSRGVNRSRTIFFTRRAKDVIDVVDPANEFRNATIAINSNVSGILSLNITPNDHTIKLVQVFNHSETSPFSIVRLGGAINEGFFDPRGNYSIDIKDFNFTRINVTRTAVAGDILYKCANFNITTESCSDLCANGSEDGDCPLQPEGLWVEIANITIGQNYTFVLTNATDPGFSEYKFAASEDEANTTSTSPVTKIQNNFSSDVLQILQIGYAELQGSSTAQDVRVRLQLNDTTNIGNLSWEPDSSRTSNPPGDYQPFFSHTIINYTSSEQGALQNLSVQFFSEASSARTFIRRARSIVVRVNNSDAAFNDSGPTAQTLSPADTYVTVANTSVTPPENQSLLVLASAEILPQSATQSVLARLLHNNTEVAFASVEGEANTDIELFATHMTVLNASANVMQNFTLQAQSEGTANKQIRRARISVIPLASFCYNTSENITLTTSSVLQNKTRLICNLPTVEDVLIIATAEVNISSATDGNFIGVHFFQNGQALANMTVGASDATDVFSFVAVTLINDYTAGDHEFSLAFRREAGSAGTVQIRRARITVIRPFGAPGKPDFTITTGNITFNNSHPREDENITITATVFNLGPAAWPSPVSVQFWDGPETIGTLIGVTNITQTPFLGGQNRTVNMTYISVIGNRTITVVVDPPSATNGTVAESNESNNVANRTLNVQSTQFYFGSLAGSNVTLEDSSRDVKYDFGFGDEGNLYFFDVDSSFNLSQLQALGRNKSGGVAFNDFGDADFNLNSTFFNDSIHFFWANNTNMTPLFTRNFTIENNTILNVPVINTSNSSLHVTGILWDTNDDTNNEYDTTDNEDLVFVGSISINKSSGHNQTVDYDVRIPALIRRLRGALNLTSIIVEIR
jgi:hypothetical protein